MARVTQNYNLQIINPSLAKQWHPTKNSSLTPKDMFPNSGKKVWWICENGHEWEATIDNRNKGSGCPYCSGKRATKEKNLQVVNPGLAGEWHPTKNDDLTPRDVTSSSGKKVWWICKKGHEWAATISSRNRGNACPYCSGRLPTEYYNLEMVNADLAKEWHPTKNPSITPGDVTPHSGKSVCWICEKGHEWRAAVSTRAKGHGCPYCLGQRASPENCLEIANPHLTKEWHPTKNPNITPRGVTPNSGGKIGTATIFGGKIGTATIFD